MRKSFLREAVWQCAAAGLTCVQTHEFGEGWSAAEAWGVYAQLQAEGDLPLRVELTTSSDEEGRPPPGNHPTAALLRCGRAKIFGDGSLGAVTAVRSLRAARRRPTEGWSATLPSCCACAPAVSFGIPRQKKR